MSKEKIKLCACIKGDQAPAPVHEMRTVVLQVCTPYLTLGTEYVWSTLSLLAIATQGHVLNLYLAFYI